MDQRVQRVFNILIVMFSIAFGILEVFFRSTNILGYSGDYWAGIFCVGVVLLIMGLAALMNFQETLSMDWQAILSFRGTQRNSKHNHEPVPPIAYISIILGAIGLVFSSTFLVFINELNNTNGSNPISLEDCDLCQSLLFFSPPLLGFISLILGIISWRISKKVDSKRGQYLANIGMLLGLICFISPIGLALIAIGS